MLISNLNENHHSFDMRKNMTELCTLILKKAQETGEIKNPNNVDILYRTLAYSFMGFETNWCISNGELNWAEEFFQGMNVLLCVNESLNALYQNYLT